MILELVSCSHDNQECDKASSLSPIVIKFRISYYNLTVINMFCKLYSYSNSTNRLI